MAKYTRVRHTQPARPPFLAVVFNYLSYVFLFAVCGAMLFLAWPLIQAQLTTTTTTAPAALPTASVAPPRPQAAPAALPAEIAIPGVAQNAATAQALYDAAVQAGEQPVQNVDLTNDSAPVIVQSKPAERRPAGENVPTAEPVVPAESGGIFGSKPVLINPQADHTCKHGQIWIDGKGCKNP
jgi:hypothetical protein